MTRKDYEAVAITLYEARLIKTDGYQHITDVVMALADKFEKTYSNFNREKFLARALAGKL